VRDARVRRHQSYASTFNAENDGPNQNETWPCSFPGALLFFLSTVK
jgi:hypothetical protein